jgi:hypothetical protein
MDQLVIQTPFDVSIDLSNWQQFLGLSPLGIVLAVFAIIGWVLVSYKLFKMFMDRVLHFRQALNHDWQHVVLAVDVPALFVQTPKAVEQIFAQLSGAVMHSNLAGHFWEGKQQKSFSFEIVSIEGYIQFLVRSELEYRDLIEAAIYAQYPEAEITEVEDYVTAIPDKYPDKEYNIDGIEFKLAEKSPYPIRTYPHFEYSLSKDAVFSDPMAAILENFSRIGHGENLWMQIIVEPINNDWKKEGIELVKEIISGKKHGHHGTSILGTLIGYAAALPKAIVAEALGSHGGEEHGGHDAHEEKEGKLSDLTPGAKTTVEAIEEKISRIGFKSKLQVLYAARKEVFNPGKCMSGFVGAMNQFHITSSNSIVPGATTHAEYDKSGKKAAHLKKKFVDAFKKRKSKWKVDPYILNTEELATIWHFPLPFVKTPLVQKAGAKRAEPPLGLPVEMLEGPLKRIQPTIPASELPKAPAAPPPDEIQYG